MRCSNLARFVFPPVLPTFTFRGNQETCANCGKLARIIDGTFDVSGEDVLCMISGPLISRTILRSFASLVDRAAKEEISADELQGAAEKLDPVLGQIVAKVRAKHFGIVMFLKSCNFNFEAKVDLNQLFNQWTGNGSKTIYTPSVDHEMKNAEDHKRSPGSSGHKAN